MTSTEQYIRRLAELKPGDLGLLRSHSDRGLDESVLGFDLFAGLWWPLRQTSARAPRREVAWLIAKLYAHRPLEHQPGRDLAAQLGRCRPREERARHRFDQWFDRLLTLSLDQIEPTLRRSLNILHNHDRGCDWVRLTDDLSAWEKEHIRLEWAHAYLQLDERG